MLDLNPPHLDAIAGPYLPTSARSSWDKMRVAIGLPRDHRMAASAIVASIAGNARGATPVRKAG